MISFEFSLRTDLSNRLIVVRIPTGARYATMPNKYRVLTTNTVLYHLL